MKSAENLTGEMPSLLAGRVPARCLLTPNRLDIAAKIPLARSWLKPSPTGAESWAMEMYAEHLRSMNGFEERSTFLDAQTGEEILEVTKNSLGDFVRSFESLVKGASQREGTGRWALDGQQSRIPVVWQPGNLGGVRFTALDGAHRIAAALSAGGGNAWLPVLCLNFPESWPLMSSPFSAEDLHRRGLPPHFIALALSEYTRAHPEARICIAFPASRGGTQGSVEKLLDQERGIQVVGAVSGVHLSGDAPLVLLEAVYRNHLDTNLGVQSRLGGENGELRETWVLNKVRNCFPAFQGSNRRARPLGNKSLLSVTVIVFEAGSDLEATAAKQAARSALGVGHASLHTTDTRDETLEAASLLLTRAGLDYLRVSRPGRRPARYQRFLSNLQSWIRLHPEFSDDLCVDAGGALAAHGLREVNDLDVIAGSGVHAAVRNLTDQHGYLAPGVQLHVKANQEVSDSIIYNPEESFLTGDSAEGLVRIAALRGAARLKRFRIGKPDADAAKDFHDLGMMRRALAPLARRENQLQIVAEPLRREAYVSFMFNEDPKWLLGLGALAQALRETMTQRALVAMVSPNLQTSTVNALEMLGWEIRTVEGVPHPHPERCAKAWQVTHGDGGEVSEYTKLRVFGLTEFSKVVYLDADTLVVGNVDALFERPGYPLSAAPSLFPPDMFNAGVMVIEPREETLGEILEFAKTHISYTCGDQGVLNAWFKDWWTSVDHRLPFIYNAHVLMYHLYKPGWELRSRAPKAEDETGSHRIYHWTGPQNKPWMLLDSPAEIAPGSPTAQWHEVFLRLLQQRPALRQAVRLPQRLAPPDEPDQFCDGRKGGGKEEGMYQGCDQVYVLHADPPGAVTKSVAAARTELEGFYTGPQAPLAGQPVVRRLSSVIGGFSALNALLDLAPEEIDYFDVNNRVVDYFRLVLALVQISATREEFVSRLFARPFNQGISYTVADQGRFLSQPLDRVIADETRGLLQVKESQVYAWLLNTHMADTGWSAGQPRGEILEQEERRRNCEELYVFFDSPGKFPRLNPGAAGAGLANQCTLYYGHGWLAGQPEYSLVRERLQVARVSLSVRDAFDKGFPQWLMRPYVKRDGPTARWDALYLSNLCLWASQGCTSILLPGLGAEVDRVGGELGNSDSNSADATVAVLHSHLEQPHILSSANIRPSCPGIPPGTSFPNSHLSAWAAVRKALGGEREESGLTSELKLPAGALLEVTTKADWGFHEAPAPGREQVELQAFLSGGTPDRSFDVVLLHILLGEGTPLKDFRMALEQATRVARRRVLILEHNKDSADWALGRPERQFSLSALQLEVVMGQTLSGAALAPHAVGPCCYVPGYLDLRRNMLSTVHISDA